MIAGLSKKDFRLAGWILLGLLVAGAPCVVAAIVWWPGVMVVGPSALLVGFTAVVSADPKTAAWISVVFAGAATLAVFLSGHAIAATIFVMLLAGGSAYMSRWGLSGSVLLGAALAPYLIREPPPPLHFATHEWQYYAAVAATALLVGLWGVAFISYALRNMPTRPRSAPTPAPDAALAAILVGAATGAVAFVGLELLSSLMWVWVILTILLLTKPDQGLNWEQTRDRAVGTVGGAVVAGALIALGLPTIAVGVLAIVLLTVALTVRFTRRPYWLYAVFMTPVIVFMDSVPGDAFEVTAERVGFTLVGAGIAVGLSFVINALVRRRRSRVATVGP